MPSADVQILGTGSSDAPLDYTLPSDAELLLKAVRADFDGSGAAGDFLPALEIISDAGHSVGVYPTDSAVLAGGSASVSFAPFLRNAGGASCGGTIDSTQTAGNTCGVHSAGVGTARVLTSDGANGSRWVLPTALHSDTAFENVISNPNSQSIASGALTAFTLAHQSQALLLDFTAPATPTFKTTGVYGITVGVIGEGAVTAVNHFTMQLLINAAAVGNKVLEQEVHSNVLADQTSGTISWQGPLLLGDSLQVKVRNRDTAARGFDIFYLSVARLLVAF